MGAGQRAGGASPALRPQGKRVIKWRLMEVLETCPEERPCGEHGRDARATVALGGLTMLRRRSYLTCGSKK